MSMTTVHSLNHIVSTPGICGGKPRIDGTRLTVQFLAGFIDDAAWTVAQICADYGLNAAQVYAAWAYYHEHQAAFDQIEMETRPDEAAYQTKVAQLKARQAANNPED